MLHSYSALHPILVSGRRVGLPYSASWTANSHSMARRIDGNGRPISPMWNRWLSCLGRKLRSRRADLAQLSQRITMLSLVNSTPWKLAPTLITGVPPEKGAGSFAASARAEVKAACRFSCTIAATAFWMSISTSTHDQFPQYAK